MNKSPHKHKKLTDKKIFLVTGIFSFIWLILRSGTKPSRISYPCQKTALTNSIGLFTFLGVFPLSKIFNTNHRISPVKIILLLVTFFGLVWFYGITNDRRLNLHHPLGTANALSNLPNRVVRIHTKNAATWNFSGCCYYNYLNQAVITSMLNQGVITLTGQSNTAAAWRMIVPDYQPGNGIAIKINNVNYSEDNIGHPNTSPQIIIAVIAGLKSIGIPESDISVFDVSYWIGPLPRQQNAIWTVYPNVKIIHSQNAVWDQTEKVSLPSLGLLQSLPTALTKSRYLINLNLMKGHTYTGITGAMKNHFGTSQGRIENLHPSVSTGSQLAELNNNPHIRDKTRLIVTEAYYMSYWELDTPSRLQYLDLFPEKTPNSLFLSYNPVALDSVLYDYIHAEKQYISQSMQSHEWLHIAADTFGLGIHEHGTLGTGIYSPKDFTYKTIDYINVNMDSPAPTPTLTPSPTVPPSPSTPMVKAGDANGDGLVNKADLIIWIGNYAKLLSGTNNADFNNNGKVNILDFGIWFANFGK